MFQDLQWGLNPQLLKPLNASDYSADAFTDKNVPEIVMNYRETVLK